MSEEKTEVLWLREQYSEMQKTAMAATARAEHAMNQEQHRADELTRTKRCLDKLYNQIAVHFLVHSAAAISIAVLINKLGSN